VNIVSNAVVSCAAMQRSTIDCRTSAVSASVGRTVTSMLMAMLPTALRPPR
jgi:hypothetical protein